MFATNLKEWQGRSLIIFNSASFSDDDFANITALGRSIKSEDHAKIGRFGLGFNTVRCAKPPKSFGRSILCAAR